MDGFSYCSAGDNDEEEVIPLDIDDQFLQGALTKGIDLRIYSQSTKEELHKAENSLLVDYIKESKSILSLHKQISSCDGILKLLEDMLNQFQNDLESISSEILTLQQLSLTMNVKLKNRLALRSHLTQYIDEMIIPEVMISAIHDKPVTDQAFIEQLHEVSHKLNFCKEQAYKGSMASSDVKDVLEKVKVKASAKIREYILGRMYQCRKPMANYQIIQNTLVKYRYLNEFLLTHDSAAAREVRDEYVDTMSKIYFSYFKSYTNKLMKMHVDDAPDMDDLIAVDENARRSLFSTKTSTRSRSAVFSVGNRATILGAELEAPVLVPHAQKPDRKFTYEVLFRSIAYALVDNCCTEYIFLVDFFMLNGNRAIEGFGFIMGRVANMFIKHLESFLPTCFDPIALFLCIRVVDKYKVVMQSRGVPALDKLWESVHLLLWSRFTTITEMNAQSIREATPQKYSTLDTKPHYITRRHVELVQSILSLCGPVLDERTTRVLEMLEMEVEGAIYRIAAEFTDHKDHLMFVINNFDMLLGPLQQCPSIGEAGGVSSSNLITVCTELQKRLDTLIQDYVEEALTPFIGKMISFVKTWEPALEKGLSQNYRVEEELITLIIRSFAAEWRRCIDGINQEVTRSFFNFKTSAAIVKSSLAQLIQYYHRFEKVLSSPLFKRIPARNELVNVHHIMVEVKKLVANY